MPHLDEGTIHAWLDGALDAAERARVEAHVAECAECAAAVAEARGLVAGASRILDALDGGMAGRSSFDRGSLNRDSGVGSRGSGIRRRWLRSGAVAAAAAVVIVGVGATLVLHGARKAASPAMERVTSVRMSRSAAADSSATTPPPRAEVPTPAPAFPGAPSTVATTQPRVARTRQAAELPAERRFSLERAKARAADTGALSDAFGSATVRVATIASVAGCYRIAGEAPAVADAESAGVPRSLILDSSMVVTADRMAANDVMQRQSTASVGGVPSAPTVSGGNAGAARPAQRLAAPRTAEPAPARAPAPAAAPELPPASPAAAAVAEARESAALRRAVRTTGERGVERLGGAFWTLADSGVVRVVLSPTGAPVLELRWRGGALAGELRDGSRVVPVVLAPVTCAR